MEASTAVSSRLIGAFFVEKGLVTQEQLDLALQKQQESGERLGEIIVADYGVSRLELASVLADRFSALPEIAEPAFRAAALTIPIAALAFTYMGATRGLKIMRFTLYSQWIAQPIGWIVLALALWSVSRTAGMTSLAFGASWALALAIAWFGWQKESGRFPRELTGTEGRIAYARQFYNDQVYSYNTKIQTFPSMLIAGPFHFVAREFFEADDESRGPVKVTF